MSAMSGNTLIIMKMVHLILCNFVSFTDLVKNGKIAGPCIKNVRPHTRIIHDNFREKNLRWLTIAAIEDP